MTYSHATPLFDAWRASVAFARSLQFTTGLLFVWRKSMNRIVLSCLIWAKNWSVKTWGVFRSYPGRITFRFLTVPPVLVKRRMKYQPVSVSRAFTTTSAVVVLVAAL